MLSKLEEELFTKNNLFDYFAGKRILLTGASGFIGGYLLEAIITTLLSKGINSTEITAITRNSSINCSRRTRDLTNVISVGEKITNYQPDTQFDVVIHAASPASPKLFTSPEYMNNVNSEFIESLMSTQRNIEVFVYFSAGEVYGTNAPHLVDETYPIGVNFDLNRISYPLAKINGEKILLDLANKHGFNPKIIRLFHTFGPGIRKDDGRSISDFFWQAVSGNPPELYSDGSSRRSFLFAADMVNAIIFILNSKSSETTFNVGASKNI
jgi:nucleoside-diphosphate-sugar epimerase